MSFYLFTVIYAVNILYKRIINIDYFYICDYIKDKNTQENTSYFIN